MDRRGASLLLIPLIAVLAIFSPTGTRKNAVESSESYRPARRSSQKVTPNENIAWNGGREAIQRFFARGYQPLSPSNTDDPRQRARLNFIVATVPDPVDSGQALSFDRFVGAIQSATQAESYVLADFNLPWEDCLDTSPKSKNAGISDQFKLDLKTANAEAAGAVVAPEDKCGERGFTTNPGFLLLGRFSHDDKDSDKGSIDLLLIYLIGESPVMGIQKPAMRAALTEFAGLSACRNSMDLRQEKACAPFPIEVSQPKQLLILGPAYSGSAQSLDLALSAWLDSAPDMKNGLSLNLVSGSATSITKARENYSGDEARPVDPEADFYNTRLRLRDRFSFSSMENRDDASMPIFFDYLCDQEFGRPPKVALLYEGNTVYGQNTKAQSPAKGKECDVSPTLLPYPLHISQLRAASEKLRQTQQQASSQPQVQTNALPLSEALEDTTEPRDLQTFSLVTPVSSEQVLGNILSTISRENFNYVGIFATDVRDTIFLAQQLRQHAPSTVLFTFSSDMLFLHPEINSAVRGMFVVSSYPLNNSNQLWSSSAPIPSRLQFSDDGSEGVYNAALSLLSLQQPASEPHSAREKMLELSLPFLGAHPSSSSPPVVPPVWISVVGRDRFWPIQAVRPNATQRIDIVARTKEDEIAPAKYWPGIFPESTLILMFGFALFCIIFSLPLVQRQRFGKSAPTARRGRARFRSPGTWKWLDQVAGPANSAQHRRRGELFLLAAASSIGAFLFIALAALSAPALIILFRLQETGISTVTHIIIGTLCAVVFLASAAMLITAIVSRALEVITKPEGEPASAGPEFYALEPITIISALVILTTLIVAGTWIYHALSINSFRPAILYSIRSLDLASGVSALLPLLLISIASFIWASTSFRRVRMLEAFDSGTVFLRFSTCTFPEISKLADKVNCCLKCAARRLPASLIVLALTTVAAAFCLVRFVRSIESGYIYFLLWLSYFAVILALGIGILRFFCVWRQTRVLLQHLAWTPLRAACKRFHGSLRSWPKIDLASPAPSLAPLALGIDQLHTIIRRAERLVSQSRPAESSATVSPGAGLGVAAKPKLAISTQLTIPELAALSRLQRLDATNKIETATQALMSARLADCEGNWRDLLVNQVQCQDALADAAMEISEALEQAWWKELHLPAKADGPPSESESIFQLAEEFLAGRISHFLAHVFPQLEILIYAPVVGSLLLLFAISSYPFQPHNLLLLFNSLVIIAFITVALLAFVEMNRDPVLSNLNGTTPGKITWDKQFIMRLIFYGVIPILALLGAQFPDTVSQILTYIMPATGMPR